MDVELTSQITKAINEQLPAQVGQVLKIRLAKAEKDAADLVTLRESFDAMKAEVISLLKQVSDEKEITRREQSCEQARKEIDAKLLKLEIHELKVAQADIRVKDMKEVVGMVFANNKFKYYESGSTSVPSGPHGVQSVSTYKSADGEG